LANDTSLTQQMAAVSDGLRSSDNLGTGDSTIELLAVAALPSGTMASREAQVHLGVALGVSRDWQILTWGRPH
jgi:hypothetical protein